MLSNLTVIIVTYKTDQNILRNCINSIDRKVKIKIIENSENFENKEIFENDFSNLSIYCTGKNLGMGSGNNFGINLVKTRYVLILNPDTTCDANFFIKINDYFSKEIKFSIIGATYKNEKTYSASGYFEENIKKNNINEYSTQISSLKKVDWVMGCSMLIDLDKFSSKKLFDENFFLYFEEFDLCKRVKDKEEDIFVSKDLIIDHLGNMGSFATDKNLKLDAEKLREWHWMWSTFYFYKKNYGFFYALKKTMGKLLRSFVKMIYYYLIFNKVLKAKYTCRLMGLLNSIFGKKSWYRVNSQYQ